MDYLHALLESLAFKIEDAQHECCLWATQYSENVSDRELKKKQLLQSILWNEYAHALNDYDRSEDAELISEMLERC